MNTITKSLLTAAATLALVAGVLGSAQADSDPGAVTAMHLRV